MKSGAMTREGLTVYILMRVRLRDVFDDFEKARAEIYEMTRHDDLGEWNEQFVPIMEKWLNEETDTIETNVLSQTDFIELVANNCLAGAIEDNLYKNLVK